MSSRDFLVRRDDYSVTDPAPSADLNGDGTVDGTDLALLLNEFGGPGQADFDGSGVIDGVDLAFLLNAFGTSG